MADMDKGTALNILKSRVLIGLGVTKNVAVTNVSFKDTDGQPFVWEEGSSSAGEPYAIANFNAVNDHGRDTAMARFVAGDYQGACNTNLSTRVDLDKGQELLEAMYASVVGTPAMVQPRDEDGEPVGEKVEAIVINKCIPNVAKDASKSKAFDIDAFAVEETEEEENAQPRVN